MHHAKNVMVAQRAEKTQNVLPGGCMYFPAIVGRLPVLLYSLVFVVALVVFLVVWAVVIAVILFPMTKNKSSREGFFPCSFMFPRDDISTLYSNHHEQNQRLYLSRWFTRKHITPVRQQTSPSSICY